MREARGDEATEFVAIQLADVELVHVVARIGVFSLVRTRQYRETLRTQHPPHFVEERGLGSDVLDRFERDDDVERRVGERQRRAVGFAKLEVALSGVARAGVRDRGRRDVGPDHACRAAREERAAVTLAARDVEHLASRDERRDEVVAMPVLVPDLACGARDEALAGERKLVVHSGHSTRDPRGVRHFVMTTIAVGQSRRLSVRGDRLVELPDRGQHRIGNRQRRVSAVRERAPERGFEHMVEVLLRGMDLDSRHADPAREFREVRDVEHPLVVEQRRLRTDDRRPDAATDVVPERADQTGERAVALSQPLEFLEPARVDRRKDERSRLGRLDEDHPAAGLDARRNVLERVPWILQVMDDRGAEHQVEGLRTEERTVQIEAVRPHTTAQLRARVDEPREQREEPRRDVGGGERGVRQEAARGEDAAPAARADVEDLERRAAIDGREREAAVDQLEEVEAFEVPLMIGLGVLDELAREVDR